MAFGFAAPDYLTRAQAGMPLDPNAPDQSPVPAAPMAAPPQAAPQGQSYTPGILDVLQGMIFNGQSPAEAAMAARQRNYQGQTMQLMAQALQNAPPERRLAMLLNPGKLGEEVAKNFAPITTAEGATQTMFGGAGAGGGSFVAPKMGFDPVSGRGYTQTPGATTPTGPSLGGGFSVSPTGAVVSDRMGLTGQTVSLPQLKPLGSSLEDFVPGLGLNNQSPAQGQTQPATAPAANANAPRGIRNNNFGNLRQLPNGHAWPGQTGVDPDGYATFATPQDGVANAAANLQSYAKQGINTLTGIVSTWAPKGDGKNDPVAYAHYLAGKLGVDPNAPLDLTDKTVQQGILRGIFDFENGPGAMAAYRAPKGALAAAPGAGATVHTLAGAASPTLLSEGDPRLARFPKGTVVQQNPNGELAVVQQPEYSPAERSKIRQQFLESEAYKGHIAASSALQALVQNIGKMTGPAAYSILDTYVRTINPGAVARQGSLAAVHDSLGLPAHIVGGLQNMVGEGSIPLQTQQQILNAVTPFAQAHYDQAKSFYDANTALATARHFDPAEVTAPIGERPKNMIATLGGAITQDAALEQARAALHKGADRALVIQRLHNMGVDPRGL